MQFWKIWTNNLFHNFYLQESSMCQQHILILTNYFLTNWTHRNKFQLIIIKHSNMSIAENAFENVACEKWRQTHLLITQE